MKQFPMVLALMTRRQTEDYVALFAGLQQAMQVDGLPCQPEAFMLDFESAAWGAIRTCFAGVKIYGCGFHWASCLQNKWKNLGLRPAVATNRPLKKLYGRVQALRFLPEEKIVPTFQRLKELSGIYPEDHKIHSFMEYIEKTWVSTNTFPPASWSQYNLTLRTNNDLEAWHRSFNKGFTRPTFYTFQEKMYQELMEAKDRIQGGDFRRRLARTTIRNNETMEALWTTYEQDPTKQLSDVLDSIAALFGY